MNTENEESERQKLRSQCRRPELLWCGKRRNIPSGYDHLWCWLGSALPALSYLCQTICLSFLLLYPFMWCTSNRTAALRGFRWDL